MSLMLPTKFIPVHRKKKEKGVSICMTRTLFPLHQTHRNEIPSNPFKPLGPTPANTMCLNAYQLVYALVRMKQKAK